MERHSNLFNQKTIKSLCVDILPTPKQEESVKKWLKLLDADELTAEKKNYLKFSSIILQDILGYSTEKIDYETDNVEFQFENDEGKKIVCFEAKGTLTKDLFAPQNRKKEHGTPVKQTWDYMGSIGLDYGICTNYKIFVLITKEYGYSKYHIFDFNSIKKDKEKLQEFIGIFSKDRIELGFVEKLHNESVIEEKDFTKEFYKLFHETRLMLILVFKENEGVSNNEAVYFTQLFLDRLIFIFFVSDKGFLSDKKLFTNRILKLLKMGLCTQHSRKIYDEITELFTAFDKGDENMGVFGFNGGLFNSKFPNKIYFSDLKDPNFFKDVMQHSKLLKTTKLNDQDSKTIEQLGNQLNLIIKNLLVLDSFDFKTEVNVNILGHIFEQSISDLKELDKDVSSKRKIDGVYYTPLDLTEYICKNTIIPYFSKKNSTTVDELGNEFYDNIEELETKFRDVKILDPACGSGAFLIKAVDVLMEIGQTIQKIKENNGKNSVNGNYKITTYNEEEELRNIIENSIYGVDINRASVEITQLSLFLKLASDKRPLIGLGKNIQVGNSLINDNTVDNSAFIWEERFPHIFMHPDLKKQVEHEDGFDIIIGNPPWQILKPDVDEFFSYLYESDDITQKFSKLTKIKKNAFIKKCLDDKKINNEWTEYQNNYKKQMDFFNKSENFEYQISKSGEKSTSSDINLYKLFIEKSYKLLKSHGYCGLIVPSGFYSDLGSKGLRELLLKKNRLIHLFSFINRKGIFEDVHRQFKFCTFVFKKEGITEKFLASFYMQDVSQLEDYKKIAYDYDVNIIQSSSPNSFSLIECKNKSEFEIFLKLYKHPLLMSDKWNFTAKREFDMTNDSQLFHTANVGYPLYEGKMMNMFTHTFSEPRYWIDKDQGKDTLKKKELNRMKRVSKSHEILPQIDSNEYRLVWRSITNSTNERTLISTILPPNIFLGNSLNYLSPINFDGEKYVHPISYDETFFICGIFNSFPIDFILRHRVATNLNIFYLMELPIPRYDKNNKLHKKLFENTVKLICTTKEYLNLMKIMNVFDPVSEPEKRLGLESQNNALSAKIYGLEKNDLKFVLENFPIVDQKLKDLTLDEFDLIDYE